MKLFLTSRKLGEIEKPLSLANLTCRSPSVHTKPEVQGKDNNCLLYTSPSPRDATLSRMPSSA